MRHPWQIWSAYVFALLVAAAAVGTVTFRALAAERAEQAARAEGALEENIRLALWRMDSLMVPFVAQENARSFQDYRSLINNRPASGMPGKTPEKSKSTAVPMSPLLAAPPVEVAAYFDLDPASTLGFLPGPARGGLQKVTDSGQPSTVVATDSLRDELGKLLRSRPLTGELPVPVAGEPLPLEFANAGRGNLRDDSSAYANIENSGNVNSQQSLERGYTEYKARSNYLAQNSIQAQRNSGYSLLNEAGRVGLMRPIVISGELFLARQAIVNRVTHVQGCWLDWKAIQQTLRDSVADLVPDAKLTLIAGESEPEPGRLMASLPVRLELAGAGLLPESAGLLAPGQLSRPLQLSLALAWVCLGLVAIAAAIVLRGVLALSERRASFVSAVTHELRTPLTTFKMYAEMLAEGMVPDEESRRRYLDTLRGEADRLSHLVENVLAYARLERGGLGNRIRDTSVDELLDLIIPRAAERVRQSNMEIVVELTDDLHAAKTFADPSAVEQIFFNLIDNAAKYAATAIDRRVHLTGELQERHVLLKVKDHGPGLPDDQRRRLFEPFHKSAADAAGSAPGVGLGLALSRRLARDMGGDLQAATDVAGGAAFIIKLRRVPAMPVTDDSDTSSN